MKTINKQENMYTYIPVSNSYTRANLTYWIIVYPQVIMKPMQTIKKSTKHKLRTKFKQIS